MNAEPRIIPVGAELPPLLTVAEQAQRNARQPSRSSESRRNAIGLTARRAAVRQRFALLNLMLDVSLPHLGRIDLAAWMLLYRHAKPDGTVTASMADLARRAGCCDRAMRRALKRLHELRLLDRLKRGTLAGGPSVWRLRSADGDRA